MSSTSQTRPRQLRADAQRNRARIMAAAEDVFASGGPSASTEDVARRAGVAIGTIFRHFPTKAALIEAVFVSRLQQLAARARSVVAEEDTATAFYSYFTETVQQASIKHAFTDELDHDDESMAAVRNAISTAGAVLHDALGALLDAAQRTGEVRSDITAHELVGLMIGAARGLEHVGEDTASRALLLAVIADGLRPRR